MKFVKKPIEVEAIRFTYLSGDEIAAWAKDAEGNPKFNWASGVDTDEDLWGEIYIDHSDSWPPPPPGEWVVKDVKGAYYPCDNEVFREGHDPVEETLGGVVEGSWEK
jgi:hypothetical protein